MRKIVKSSLVAALLLGAVPVWAQTEQVDLYDLSLEELMNVSVVSASKEKERLFDAPVAAYTLTREEMAKAGVLSIPEALRLIPGIIVRETTNGNYDVHLRGYDNTAKYTYGQNQTNILTLVMINNRPVFNYNQGGTLWESLPVDLADIERIEVVCGPSAPLFGPNAVTGVINIITRDFNNKKFLTSAQLQGSLPGGSVIGSMAIGKQFGDKLSVGLTGNYQERQRLDDEQYVFSYGGQPAMYTKSDEYRMLEAKAQGLDPERALLRKGVNAYVSYAFTDKIKIDYSAGAQHAQAQKVGFTSLTPLMHTESNSFYNNLAAKIHDLSLRMSYVNGDDELHKLGEGYTTAYDYQLMELTADYELRVHSKLKIRPSFNYQTSTYSNLERLDKSKYPLGGLLNAEQSMNAIAGSLRADFTPIKGLRLIGSGRMDKFDVNDDLYLSYQFASTYAVSDNLMLRAVHGKSYSGIFYNTAFIDATVPTSATSIYVAVANKDIRATANTLTELGMRLNLKSNLQADLTVFTQKLEDISLFTYQSTSYYPIGGQVYEFDFHEANNLAYTMRQNGITASLNWLPNKQWQVRPFITLQQTEAQNFDFYNNPAATGVAYKGADVKQESTPAVFGGWYINYSPFTRLNINTSAYFFSDHTMSRQQDLYFSSKEGEIAAKMLINARASFLVVDKLSLFIGGKNLMSQNTREYYGTDRMGSQYFGGINYNF